MPEEAMALGGGARGGGGPVLMGGDQRDVGRLTN